MCCAFGVKHHTTSTLSYLERLRQGEYDVEAREDGMEKICLQIVHLPWEASR